jgi:dihydroflavonol-4-reductase
MFAVTGSDSALGRKIVTLLKERGVEVKPLDNLDEAANNIQGCQAVYHCLEYFDVSNRSQEFYDTNVEGTEKLMRAAVTAGVKRVLLVSSIAAAGPQDNLHLRTEEDPAEPLPAPYQETKKMGEEKAQEIAGETGMELVIVRPSFLVGKGAKYPALWFAAFANSLLRVIPCGRNSVYNFIGIDDAAEGCILAMEKGQSGEVYTLAADEHLSLQHTLALFSELSGLPPVRNVVAPMPLMLLTIHLRELLPGLKPSESITGEFIESYLNWSWVFSNQKAKKELGFAPKPIEQYWEETILWAAKQKLLRQHAADTVKNNLAASL